jgi:hypothetical protein
LAQWRRAVDRSNDTFYKSRDRLVEEGKVRLDGETARYIAAKPKPSPGPELVQNNARSNQAEADAVVREANIRSS